MIGRIRGLLDRPLDPSHARAVIVLAFCLTLTCAALVGIGVIDGARPGAPAQQRSRALDPGAPSAAAPVPTAGPSSVPDAEGPRTPRRQDPQDRRGSAAYRRARRTLREHRALQRLPFRRGRLRVTLTGAVHGHAVIRVLAPTLAGARRGWNGFLRRLGDDGDSYLVRFRARPRQAAGPLRKLAGPLAGGFAGPFAGRSAGSAGIRHHRPHRGPHRNLKSPPRPRTSP